MQIKVTSNFKFSNMANAIPDIIEKGLKKTAKTSADASKKAISSGLQPPLKESTLKVREIRGYSGSTPLIASGRLHKSIKPTENKMAVKEYGLIQAGGFTPAKVPHGGALNEGRLVFVKNTKGITVPARNFIKTEANLEEIADKIVKLLK